MHSKILVLGAGGQIGTELTIALRKLHGTDAVIASDIKSSNKQFMNSGPFEFIDATDFNAIKSCVGRLNIDTLSLIHI